MSCIQAKLLIPVGGAWPCQHSASKRDFPQACGTCEFRWGMPATSQLLLGCQASRIYVRCSQTTCHVGKSMMSMMLVLYPLRHYLPCPGQ